MRLCFMYVALLCIDYPSTTSRCSISGITNLRSLIIKNNDINKLHIISNAMGISLLLITYLVVQYVNFGIYLPISATMAIIALPLMALIFIKGGKA